MPPKKSKTKLGDKKIRKGSSSVSKTNLNDELKTDTDTTELTVDTVESIEVLEEPKETKAEIPVLDPVTQLFPLLIKNWTGTCVEDVPHGFGHCEFTSNATYTGMMDLGRMHGKGEITLPNGYIYKGEFFKNSLQGHGRIIFPDDSEYEGSVVDGFRHGQGHYIMGHFTYMGGWKAGLRHGNGIMRYSQTSFYDGGFLNGKENGYGTRQWTNLDVYKGYFKDGKRYGNGHMIWKQNQEEYEGEWVDGVQNGFGIGTSLLNGRKTMYSGNWLSGKRHGEGRIEYSNGSTLSGEWENGKKIGKFVIQHSTGEFHVVYFVNDKIDHDDTNFLADRFQSLTENELAVTFGEHLVHGKEAIIRNIYKCRELYLRYSQIFPDRKFRLMHFDKLFLDYELSHLVPVVELYPTEEKNPLSFLLFREFSFYLVNAANKLWPDMDLDNAIQKLFNDYLNKQITDKSLFLNDEFQDFVPHFFVIWENCNYRMTARHVLQLIRKLQLPFSAKSAVEVLSEYDRQISDDIERDISFIQFGETLIKLMVGYKDNIVKERMDDYGNTSSLQLLSTAESKNSGRTGTGHDIKDVSDVSTRASGSLLQTISNMSEQDIQSGKSSLDNIHRNEIFSFFHENIMAKWIQWKKILEITKEEKEETIFDISGLVVNSKTTINSGSDNTI